MGPVVSERQRDRVESYVAVARSEGANVLAGGGRPHDSALAAGFFVEPTVRDARGNDTHTAQEEIFGPVLTVIDLDDVEEAARVAIASRYGLSATIWTHDIDKALTLASQIKSGQVYVNAAGGGTRVELPFGGFKKSAGAGRTALRRSPVTRRSRMCASASRCRPEILRACRRDYQKEGSSEKRRRSQRDLGGA